MSFLLRETPSLDFNDSAYFRSPTRTPKVRRSARFLRAVVAIGAALAPALLAGSGAASANTLLALVESFKTPELAAELMAELRLRAPPGLADRATVVPTYVPTRGGVWYRVLIGAPTSRARVRSICASLLASDFRHCLPVHTGASVGAYVPGAGFLAFLGSFENRPSAEQMAEDIRARAGHLLMREWVTVRLIDVPDRGWRYRVVVGPRTSQVGAQAVCDSLWRVGFNACFPTVEAT